MTIKNWTSSITNLKIATLTLFAAISLNACRVTPEANERDTISFVNNVEDAGIIGFLPDGSLEITIHARDRYNAFVSQYGGRFTPPILKDYGVKPLENGNYSITLEACELWKQMILISARIQ